MIYLRDMKDEDVNSVAELYKEVAFSCHGLLYDPEIDRVDLRNTVRGWIFLPRSVIKVLCTYDTNEVIGAAIISPEAPAFSRLSHAGELFMMISPKHQGRGYGTRMLGEVIDKAFSIGYEKIVLEVADNNENAKALYSKFGFMHCGTRYNEIKYGPGVYVNTLLMELHKRLS